MLNRLIILTVLGCLMWLPASITMASEEEQKQETKQTQEQKQVYGWQLMTPEERAEHRAKMRTFNTKKEREAYRLEHHKKMEKRAKKRGVTLRGVTLKGVSIPGAPSDRGRGMNPCGGRGTGMGGPGGGKGRGR